MLSSLTLGLVFADAQGNQVDAARSLAYLLNANLTLSGGCPNPPLTEYFTDQVCLCIDPALLRQVWLAQLCTQLSICWLLW